MKRKEYLFIFFAITSAYGSDRIAIVLPLVPFVVPALATIGHYLATDYESKTTTTLQEELEELENIKKDLCSLIKDDSKNCKVNVSRKKVGPVLDRFNKNAILQALCDISDYKNNVEITMNNRSNAPEDMKYIYNTLIANYLFYDKDSLLSCINFCINKTTQRLEKINNPIPFQPIDRLKTVYIKNYPTTMAFFWTTTLIGITLPLLYIYKKRASGKKSA